MSDAGTGGPGGTNEIRELVMWVRIAVVILVLGGGVALVQLAGLPDRLAERVPSDASGSNADAQIDTVTQKLDRICTFLGMQSAAPVDDPCAITSP